MLAFTMQFSRYGRNKGPLGASAPRRPRPFESAPIESGCFLRTQQCAHPAGRPPRSFGTTAKAARLLAARSRASRMNSQCSTRKHGRPGERMPPEGAGAP